MAKYDWKYLDEQDIIDNKLNDDGIAYWTVHFNVKKMVEYLNKDSKIKRDWWCTSNFGQDHVTLVAEHNDYGVRIFFEFDEDGYCDAIRKFMSTYETDNIGSWYYSKYDIDYSFDLIKDMLMNYEKKYMESVKKNRKSVKESYKHNASVDLADKLYKSYMGKKKFKVEWDTLIKKYIVDEHIRGFATDILDMLENMELHSDRYNLMDLAYLLEDDMMEDEMIELSNIMGN